MTAWLEWLVLGAGRELMLFASVGILLIGLDDLLFDATWIAICRRKGAAQTPGAASRLDGRLAIFVPAWDEAEVLPAMLRRTLAAWDGEDFRIYVGCYPNDAATLVAISPLIASDRRLRLVIGDALGPTTKGDNLNRLWAAVGEDERAESMRFAGVVLHDAEDHVHPKELALYREHLVDHAMVQIPVVPIVACGSRWICGHYGDEFAEAHGKEMVLRSHVGAPIPSAGVGCAFTRNAVAVLAIERGGQPFRADSLTEDYEVGMLIGAYGLAATFVDSIGVPGDPVVSRGVFPSEVEAAVRQKARWIAGIALAGWDHLGWLGLQSAKAEADRRCGWFARWMLWRDRRAPLAAIIILAAYTALILVAVGIAGQMMLGWAAPDAGDGMRLLLAMNAMLLLWRLAMRWHFTARIYGWREAAMSCPRAIVANVIAILAARRAIMLYARFLRSGQIIWDKTRHADYAPASDAVPVRAKAR